MAYSANTHATWVTRVRNLMRELHHIALVEGDIIDEIFLNQGGNTNDPDYVSVDYATTNEMADAITTIREVQQLLDGTARPVQLDRRSRFTPWLQ